MQETPARLGVGSSGDGRGVFGFLVQNVTGCKGQLRTVLQELAADFCVQDEQVVVHPVRDISSVQIETRNDCERPTADIVAEPQLRRITEDIVCILGIIAVVIAVPVEIVI